MRIHITGAAGSGTTTLGRALRIEGDLSATERLARTHRWLASL